MENLASRIDELLLTGRSDRTLVVEALVNEYYIQVYRFAVSILQNTKDAEDATQEAFIAAITHLDKYRAKTNIKAWLFTIAINNCRDRLRKYKRWQKRFVTWYEDRTLASRDPSPEVLTIRKEADSELWSVVNKMGEKHRTTIILRFVHGMSVREIAEILDISEGTVHSRLHYAIRKLQNKKTSKTVWS
jgi:RNA polymerase sigma-70 factor (ECF subfamily)